LSDDAVDFHDEVIAKINAAKSKKEFNAIVETLKKGGEDFVKKLNAL
jgi:hypothetical protein